MSARNLPKPVVAEESPSPGARDTVFQEPAQPESFEFDERVAAAFDDMAVRSIPDYHRLQDLIADIALRSCPTTASVVDLGCATGTTLDAIARRARGRMTLIGVDRSAEMLDVARAKLRRHATTHDVRLYPVDLLALPTLSDQPAGVVVLAFTLQFIRPLERQRVLESVRSMLHPQGVLMVVEKTVQPVDRVNHLFLDAYHDFKQAQGYSRAEIARKREAYHNRLVPFRPEENQRLLASAGFSTVAVFYSHLNFQGYLACDPRSS